MSGLTLFLNTCSNGLEDVVKFMLQNRNMRNFKKMQFCLKIHCLGKVLPRDLKALSAMRRIHQVPKTLSKKYLRDTFLYTPGQQEDE